MGSPSHPTSLPQPYEDPNLARTFQGFRAALSRMSIPQLQDQLTRINALLQADVQARLTSTIYDLASASPANLDSPVLRSPRMASRPPTDRGSARSQASPAPAPPSAVELLARSRSLAPRLAAKLVVSDARRASRERE